MSAVDLKTLTDDELQEQWGVAYNAMNAVYREQLMLSKVRAAYNVANYLKLHRTEEGKQQYRAAHAEFDATEAEVRQRFHAASAVCTPFVVEARLRGLVTDADWQRTMRRRLGL